MTLNRIAAALAAVIAFGLWLPTQEPGDSSPVDLRHNFLRGA